MDPAALSAQVISRQPPADIALDFGRLLDVGLAAAQRVSGAIWTDYNTHDPGVTILELLAFALTDVAYRISHPIEDLIASSIAEGGAPLDRLALFTGDRILTCAPHSDADLCKLAYDSVLGLRNLWLKPAEGAPGVYQPVAQIYDGSKDVERILGEVAQNLAANRPLGVDFLYPINAPLRELALEANIAIAREASAESVLAEILYRIEQRINPAPQLREVGADLAAGVSPADIFDGPRLSHGWISNASLSPYAVDLKVEDLIDSILGAPGVNGLASLKQPDADWLAKAQQDGCLVVLSRRPEDIERVTILRDGVVQVCTAKHVLTYLNHLEQRVRWEAGYASHQTDQLAYAHVPLGKAGRQLGTFRSVQPLFPPNYRLGPGIARPRGATARRGCSSRPTCCSSSSSSPTRWRNCRAPARCSPSPRWSALISPRPSPRRGPTRRRTSRRSSAPRPRTGRSRIAPR